MRSGESLSELLTSPTRGATSSTRGEALATPEDQVDGRVQAHAALDRIHEHVDGLVHVGEVAGLSSVTVHFDHLTGHGLP